MLDVNVTLGQVRHGEIWSENGIDPGQPVGCVTMTLKVSVPA
jgi:hypothetical protein